MSTPIARYTVIIDRYLTDDCDGTGVLHDGTVNEAIGQLNEELQEACDVVGLAGHFTTVGRKIISAESWMSDLPRCDMEDDPPEYRHKLRYSAKQIKLDTTEGLEVYYGVWDQENKVLCPSRLYYTLDSAETEAKHLNVLHGPIRFADDNEGSDNES